MIVKGLDVRRIGGRQGMRWHPHKLNRIIIIACTLRAEGNTTKFEMITLNTNRFRY